VIAETDRLFLRELCPADAAPLFEMYRNPHVMRFMGPPPPSAADEARNIRLHVENCYRRLNYGVWAVIEKATGRLVGRAGLLRFDSPSEPQVEISYLLGRPHWGRGYATEAGAAVVRYAFGTLRLGELVAFIQAANSPSVRVAERLGFRREGVVPYKNFGLVDLYRLRCGTAGGSDCC
jgi:RimJ/RimL family protein N-acetyltransferase